MPWLGSFLKGSYFIYPNTPWISPAHLSHIWLCAKPWWYPGEAAEPGSALTQLTDEAMTQVRARRATKRRWDAFRSRGDTAGLHPPGGRKAPSPREPRWPRVTGAQPSPGAGLATGVRALGGRPEARAKEDWELITPLPAGRPPTALRLFSAALAGAASNQMPKTAAFFLSAERLGGWD